MPRSKTRVPSRARRKNILKAAKGYYGAKSKLVRVANQAVMKSGNYAFVGRKAKKRVKRTVGIKVNLVLIV